jgi:hypothetical protein
VSYTRQGDAWVRPTEKLIIALKLSKVPAYKLALRSGFDPSGLSRWLHGGRRLELRDPRVRRLAALLKLRVEDAVTPGAVDVD